MAWMPAPVSRANVDQDSDDVFQARGDINSFGNAINEIRQYLVELFGVDGTKGTAITTLFSNQAVLFPAGTRVYFMNATVPPGWEKYIFDQGRYLMAVPDDSGGSGFGTYNVVLQTAATPLIREHLPVLTLSGTTDFQGWHSHEYIRTRIENYQPEGGAAGIGEVQANEKRVWFFYAQDWTAGQGSHAHNISLPLGGAGWGHNHTVDMSPYRPATIRGVIGTKI